MTVGARSTVSGTSASEDGLLSLIDSGFEGATAASEIGGGTDVVNPSDLLRVLDGNDASTTRVGPQTVDGVATTHYKAVVPLGDLGLSAGETAEATVLLGISSLPVDYSVDSSGHLVQLRIAITVKHFPVGLSPSTVASSTTSITVLPNNSFRLAKGKPPSIRWVAARSNSLSPSRSRSICPTTASPLT